MTDFTLGTDYVSAVQSGLLLFITLLWLVGVPRFPRLVRLLVVAITWAPLMRALYGRTST